MRLSIQLAQVTGSILLVSLATSAPTVAQQIVPDTTLGNESSILRTNVDVKGALGDRIDGGARRGGNLFHSFTEFGVREGQRVYFNNPPGVINILGRVTGSNLSTILGTLGITGGAANLFLINPNGILFGQNASLDIGGSFVASTARSLIFADATQFTATPTQSQPLLTVSAPIGLQFGNSPQAISVTGWDGQLSNFLDLGLRVQPGKTLALVGGNVTLEGAFLTAPEGHVELGGIAGAGTVGLSDSSGSLRLSFPPNGERADVALTSSVDRFPENGGPALVGGIKGFSSGSSISINARVLLLNGGSLSSTFIQGNSGDIDINAASVFLKNGAQIDSSNSGGRQAGTINIEARDSVSIESGSTISSQTDGQGSGGSIQIKAGSFSLTNGSRLNSSTIGLGNAGKISLTVRDATTIANGFINSSAGVAIGEVVGNAGDIEIQTGALSMTDGAGFFTANTGGTRAGNIIINARDNVSLNKSYIHNPNPSNSVSGNVNINAKSFSAVDSALIVATFGSSNAGNIVINTSESVIVSRVNPDLNQLAGIRLTTPGIYTSTTATGNAGNLTVQTGTLQVLGGARLSASTSGPGVGGALTVNASSVELSGISADGQSPSGLFTETRGVGLAGSLTVNAQQVTVKDDAQISAATTNSGLGGNIKVAANTVELTTGGQLRTTTFGSGQAGNIAANIVDTLSLSGINTGLLADTEQGSTGNGGSIFIDPRTVIIQDGAKIAVNSAGSGKGGDIQLQAGTLTLDNQGRILAETASNQGGNITLQLQDLLLLRRGSLISATAGTSQAGGDGGNITINTPFIVSVLSENNDIRANAFTGRGGNVTIAAQGIFGIQPQLFDTFQSDITASSQFGLSGVVTINTPDVDPSRGLAPLPTNLVDPSRLISQGCSPRGTRAASSFVATGRGGIPPSPTDPLINEAVSAGWVTVQAGMREEGGGMRTEVRENTRTRGHRNTESSNSIQNSPSSPTPIIEAQGWVKDGNGNISLVSALPAVVPHEPAIAPSACR
jgi:filamentous hemagglutinin family protein